jgi:hypothetical protein
MHQFYAINAKMQSAFRGNLSASKCYIINRKRPMFISSNGTSSPCNSKGDMRSWVQDPLGASVAYHLKKREEETEKFTLI